MNLDSIKAGIAKHGQLMVVTLGKGIPPTIVVKNNDIEQSVFNFALWGFVSYETSDHQVQEAVYIAKYRSKPAFVGPCEKVKIVFAFDTYQSLASFALVVNDSIVPNALIRQLAFFAATNRGTVVLSYCPAIGKDASEFVASVSGDHEFGNVIQHLAAFWLQKIWGTQE